METTSLSLYTLIPKLPEIINNNFTATKNYIDVFYNETSGVIIKPVDTTGRVKASMGEFVNVVTDYLTVKSQYINMYDNISTADYQYYKTYILDDVTEPRDASTTATPGERTGIKYIDVIQPYYKIPNNMTIGLVCDNLSQVVRILPDPSVATGNPYEILLNEQTDQRYTITHADASTTYAEFIVTAWDASWGPTWELYKFGTSDPSWGSGSSYTLFPATYTTLGGMMPGSTLNIGVTGIVDVSIPYVKEASIGSGLFWVDGSLDVSIASTITELSDIPDVSVGGKTADQVLTWDGTYWTADDVSTGTVINELSDIGDVSVGGKTTNQVLTWDGSYWSAEDVSTVGTGTTYSYVDGSLSARDTSIAYIVADISILDNSIYQNTFNITFLDASTVQLGTSIAEVDASMIQNAEAIAALDVSTINSLNDIQDVSVGGTSLNQVLTWGGVYWGAEDVSSAGSGASYSYVDGSLSARDVSIAQNAYDVANIPPIVLATEDASGLVELSTQLEIDASVPSDVVVATPEKVKNMKWENTNTLCSNASTTNIVISTTDTSSSAFHLHYQAYRVIDTSSLYQSGTIDILIDPSDSIYYSYDYIGEELDSSIGVDLSGTDIRLNVEVGTVNSNDLFFHYNNISTIYRYYS